MVRRSSRDLAPRPRFAGREPIGSRPISVDALSATQVLALGSLRKRVDKEELTHGQKENYTYLILCTVSGVAAGLQNTG